MAIKSEFKNQVQIIREVKHCAEMMFFQMRCGRMILTTGLIYAPQENQTTSKEMEEMYEIIEQEISEARTEGNMVLLAGDFNCKVGDIVKGNKKEVTKGGRKLIKLAQNNNMEILNINEMQRNMDKNTKGEKGNKEIGH